MKVLKQLRINVEANKELCDGCALQKAHGKNFGTRKSHPNVVGEQINGDVCVWTNDKNITGRCPLLRLLLM
jgi:hypothetical protein